MIVCYITIHDLFFVIDWGRSETQTSPLWTRCSCVPHDSSLETQWSIVWLADCPEWSLQLFVFFTSSYDCLLGYIYTASCGCQYMWNSRNLNKTTQKGRRGKKKEEERPLHKKGDKEEVKNYREYVQKKEKGEKRGRSFTFNGSPLSLPPQQPPAIDLVLLVTAHHSKWDHLLQTGRRWRDDEVRTHFKKKWMLCWRWHFMNSGWLSFLLKHVCAQMTNESLYNSWQRC